MAAVTDAIEKNTTLTATATTSATMINNGATSGVPVTTIAAMTGMGMTGKIAVPDVMTTATMIATAAGGTATAAPLRL